MNERNERHPLEEAGTGGSSYHRLLSPPSRGSAAGDACRGVLVVAGRAVAAAEKEAPHLSTTSNPMLKMLQIAPPMMIGMITASGGAAECAARHGRE